MSDAYFLSVPHPVLKCQGLVPLDKLILSDVLSFRSKGLEYFRAMSSMAEQLGAPERTIRYRLTILERDSYLVITHRGDKRKPNLIDIGPKLTDLLEGRLPDPVINAEAIEPDPVAPEAHETPPDPIPATKPDVDAVWASFEAAERKAGRFI